MEKKKEKGRSRDILPSLWNSIKTVVTVSQYIYRTQQNSLFSLGPKWTETGKHSAAPPSFFSVLFIFSPRLPLLFFVFCHSVLLLDWSIWFVSHLNIKRKRRIASSPSLWTRDESRALDHALRNVKVKRKKKVKKWISNFTREEENNFKKNIWETATIWRRKRGWHCQTGCRESIQYLSSLSFLVASCTRAQLFVLKWAIFPSFCSGVIRCQESASFA